MLRLNGLVRAAVAVVLLASAAEVAGCEPSTPEVTEQKGHSTPVDSLPSWRDDGAKKSILEFVRRVTSAGGTDFVPVDARIATFDNDGTLWTEQPNYVQAEFVKERVKALASQHPDWKGMDPFQGVLEGDDKAIARSGQRGVMELLAATSAGMTTEEFEDTVKDWMAEARDARWGRRHDELVYQPMLELLAFLRANQFKTFIVSGGGADFIRPWAETTYGVPPEQVVGSRLKVAYEVRDGTPVLLRKPELDFVDDGPGKPVGIHQMIGQRPIAAFGNSDGDFEMLEWTTSAPGPRLALIVHHTDGAREWAYDRDADIGKLARALDEAPKRGWIVVDMKKEWKAIYPFDRGGTWVHQIGSNGEDPRPGIRP